MILAGRLLIEPDQPPRLGWMGVAEDRIAEVGFGKPFATPDLGGEDHLICPGFIDAHLHIPQIEVAGCDGPDLLHWLERVIYPAEAQWKNHAFACRQIRLAHRRLLQAGTLGYAGYLSSHEHAPECLIKAASPPLRARVGQTLMDRGAPDGLLEPGRFDFDIPADGRIARSINPRFAVSCSDSLLAEVRRAVRDGVFIQTHLAEAPDECELVAGLFPDDEHYAGVYDRHGLLTERTLLAHCVHLTEPQWLLIARRRSVVVHCPTANTFLSSGLFDLDAARRHGVRLALGSDLAAGPDLSMPRVARAMIETAKVRAMTIAPDAYVPTPADAWRLITTGNAEALGWPDGGRLEVGAAADLLLLRPPFPVDDHLIARLLYTWRDDYIVNRIVAGHPIDCPPSEDTDP
ncbi:MAG: amidohydrolase family protein [Phycisphaerales bacterium]|nr:MAG: amidohydrolase family protein [Phycisphaerales bacterium]